jgi:aspartate ammonia-lyase
LLKELHGLEATLGRKAVQFKNIRKLARTHLQDAVPTTLGAEFGAFKGVVNRHKATLLYAQKVLLDANLGGSAIGNCVNATPVYRRVVYKELRRLTGIPLRPAKNLMSATSSATDFLVLAQALVALSADLSKIANDLRQKQLEQV